MKYLVALTSLLTVGLVSCNGQQQSSTLPTGAATAGMRHRSSSEPSPIQHIVIIVQENRTPDYLFQGVPGADIAKTALNSEGKIVPLIPVSLAAPYDLGHGHARFLIDCDMQASNVCKMDGFDEDLNRREAMGPFAYAPFHEVRPYHDMARQYAFADRMFQSNQAGSFPAHQYLVSGTASALPDTPFNVSSEPFNSENFKHEDGGCDAQKLSVVSTIDPRDGSAGPTPFPCFERPVLSDLLDQQSVTWRYYQHNLGSGIWHALDAIKHVRYGPDYANVVTPPETILSDIPAGRLPGVSWVMPADDKHSDHATTESAAGPSWVAAVVNTLGQSAYWNSTAIFITWDDWGGWYDHVPPPQYGNYYELGFRVPLVIVSPYAKAGYVSHQQHEFASILNFAEVTFGIPKGSLGTTDQRADDLMDSFDFTQMPRPFVKIRAPKFVPAKGPSGGVDAEDPE